MSAIETVFAAAAGLGALTIGAGFLTLVSERLQARKREPSDETVGDQLSSKSSARQSMVIVEINGRRIEVKLPADFALRAPISAGTRRVVRRSSKHRKHVYGGPPLHGDALIAPMQGTVVNVAVEEGQEVSVGDLVVVLEAMKAETPVTAPTDGIISGLSVEPGAQVTQGSVLASIKY